MKQSHNDYTLPEFYELVTQDSEWIVRGNYKQVLNHRNKLYKSWAYESWELYINNINFSN